MISKYLFLHLVHYYNKGLQKKKDGFILQNNGSPVYVMQDIFYISVLFPRLSQGKIELISISKSGRDKGEKI